MRILISGASQYASTGPAMLAPEMRIRMTASWGLLNVW